MTIIDNHLHSLTIHYQNAILAYLDYRKTLIYIYSGVDLDEQITNKLLYPSQLSQLQLLSIAVIQAEDKLRSYILGS